MNEGNETRELITLEALGIRIQGTLHKPRENEAEPSQGASGRAEAVHPEPPQLPTRSPSRVGIFFLNSLSLPRAATGDSAVYWADAFAQCGYASFRMDLPGMGDSDGDLPSDLLDFINSGGYAPPTAATIDEIVERFRLSGIILVGHCAGAVSAIYTAALSGKCKGLILLDTYFHLPRAVRPKVRQTLSTWALQSRVGAVLSDLFDHIKDLALAVRRGAPPKTANFKLLRSWKELASSGLPILIFKAPARKAPGTKPRTGEFDYLQYVVKLAGRKGRVEIKLIEGADHSFSGRPGRARVREEAESWLNAFFPRNGSPAANPEADCAANPDARHGSAVLMQPSETVSGE